MARGLENSSNLEVEDSRVCHGFEFDKYRLTAYTETHRERDQEDLGAPWIWDWYETQDRNQLNPNVFENF